MLGVLCHVSTLPSMMAPPPSPPTIPTFTSGALAKLGTQPTPNIWSLALQPHFLVNQGERNPLVKVACLISS